jgi:hypothetical protein
LCEDDVSVRTTASVIHSRSIKNGGYSPNNTRGNSGFK